MQLRVDSLLPSRRVKDPYTHFRGMGRKVGFKMPVTAWSKSTHLWFCSLKFGPFHHLKVFGIKMSVISVSLSPTNKYLSKHNLNIKQPVSTSFLDSFLWAGPVGTIYITSHWKLSRPPESSEILAQLSCFHWKHLAQGWLTCCVNSPHNKTTASQQGWGGGGCSNSHWGKAFNLHL